MAYFFIKCGFELIRAKWGLSECHLKCFMNKQVFFTKIVIKLELSNYLALGKSYYNIFI